ncbi:uncharacterized protein RCC_04419 [Ramularia collo-cygni]|uniref:Uncharacterized protein n=1 Tax=Ramularia collo-cygni TaxID=112498 RepID=A0A2D3UWE1_9PEZI|nr:uncharacterized protein RCC_04419 [Ramularia collo-cygni]CZT18575.1 uncharacterized protein RCC_04419 [Ramularia collo-cygni]
MKHTKHVLDGHDTTHLALFEINAPKLILGHEAQEERPHRNATALFFLIRVSAQLQQALQELRDGEVIADGACLQTVCKLGHSTWSSKGRPAFSRTTRVVRI